MVPRSNPSSPAFAVCGLSLCARASLGCVSAENPILHGQEWDLSLPKLLPGGQAEEGLCHCGEGDVLLCQEPVSPTADPSEGMTSAVTRRDCKTPVGLSSLLCPSLGHSEQQILHSHWGCLVPQTSWCRPKGSFPCSLGTAGAAGLGRAQGVGAGALGLSLLSCFLLVCRLAQVLRSPAACGNRKAATEDRGGLLVYSDDKRQFWFPKSQGNKAVRL